MDIKEAIGIFYAIKAVGGGAEPDSPTVMAISALEKQVEKKPYPDGDNSILACPYCGSGEYLHNPDGNVNQYCGQCGQKIDWSE